MKLLGSGIDIVEVARIARIIDRHGSRFIKKILHQREQEELAKVSNKATFTAKRFAVKEAAAKALGTGIGRQVAFTDIYVQHDALGKPILCFSEQSRLRLQLGNKQTMLTIADERSYAVAHVLLYSNDML